MLPEFEPVTIDYDCTRAELAEAGQVLFAPGQAAPVNPPPTGRAWVGWVMFITLTIVFFILIRKTDPAGGADAPGPYPMSSPLFVTGLVLTVAAVALMVGGGALARRGRHVLARLSNTDMRWTFRGDGLVREGAGVRESWSWAAFGSFAETDHLLAVRLTPAVACIFPKRLFANADDLGRVRQLLIDHLSPKLLPQQHGFEPVGVVRP